MQSGEAAGRSSKGALIGRERELTALLDVVAESATLGAARAAVVTGPEGMGKSRLARELTMRAAERGTAVWLGRADPAGRATPYSVLGDMLNRLAQIGKGEPLERRREKLRERLGRHLDPDMLWETAAVLGEAAGTSFFDARSDGGPWSGDGSRPAPPPGGSALLADLATRTWEDFLSAELSHGPLLLLIDDAEGADLPSMRLFDAALRNLSNRPLVVVALGGPELPRMFPGLFGQHRPVAIELGELDEIASRELLSALTHDRLAPATLTALAARSGGNPFVLEGMALAVTAGTGDRQGRSALVDLPDTVQATAASRFNAAPPETRRLLRAASVLGEVVSVADLSTLLGGAMDAAAVHLAIDDACSRDLLERRSTGRGASLGIRLGGASLGGSGSYPAAGAGGATGSGAYPAISDMDAALVSAAPLSLSGGSDVAFRSPIVRQVAYASFSDEDRARVHLLAAQRLAAADRDPAVLAWHYERGGAKKQAVEPYRIAAVRALAANDFEAAITRAQQAEASGAEGAALGEVARVLADAHIWRGETAAAEREARRAMDLLPAGSVSWVQAASAYAVSAARLGNTDALYAAARDVEALASARPFSATDPPLRVALLVAMARLSVALVHAGAPGEADGMLGRMHALRMAGALDDLPFSLGHVHRAHAIRAHVRGDLLPAFLSFDAAAQSFERARALRDACTDHANAGFLKMELGQNEDAEKRLSAALATATRLGLPTVVANAQLNLSQLLARRGAVVAAASMAETALATYEKQASARAMTIALVYLARILAGGGAAKAAEPRARRAVLLAEDVPPYRAYAYAALSSTALALGHVGEAVSAGEAAMAALREVGTEEGEAFVRLCHVEALSAAGRAEEARLALFRADEKLAERAARITDPAHRTSFLQNIPEHARTVAVAEALGVGPTARAPTMFPGRG